MLDYNKNNQSNFVQEYAYIEDYSLFYPSNKTKEEDEEVLVVVDLDVSNVTTFEI